MGLETAEAVGGLQHGGSRPAQGHRGIAPVLHVAADTPDRAVHVLDDVGAGQRTAQFGGQADAIDGENFVEALQNAVPDAWCVVFQAAGKIAHAAWCGGAAAGDRGDPVCCVCLVADRGGRSLWL